MQIDVIAPQYVRDIIASLGRTEDVRFSPSNHRLAVAQFIKNTIVVFDVSIAASHNSTTVSLISAAEFSSADLNSIHGIDFIDNQKILVANREGRACIFELPTNVTGCHELTPMATIGSQGIVTPGSVTVLRTDPGFCEVLVCNNYINKVTKHFLDIRGGHSIESYESLLKKWLDIPDGICVNKERSWVAVSNHNTHSVFLYKIRPSLTERSDPDGILRGVNFPHGLRFTSDGHFILVADAGAPYVHIYETENSLWQGVRDPVLSFRVLSDELFLRGRSMRAEGGPKGIDINNAMNVLVTTCENQPLAFFDAAAILKSAHSNRSAQLARTSPLAMKCELYRGRVTAVITTTLRWVLRVVRTLTSLELKIGLGSVPPKAR